MRKHTQVPIISQLVGQKTTGSTFQSIPVNTLLFGCETWTLTETNKKKISSAYQYGLREVLGLRMTTVENTGSEMNMFATNLVCPTS
jgi:hypothetical protein